MKKLFVASALALALTGCGAVDRGIAKFTGSSEMCVDGVKYIQFTSGATVKYNTDGSIALCTK